MVRIFWSRNKPIIVVNCIKEQLTIIQQQGILSASSNCSNAEIKSINDNINKLADIVTAACSTINALTTSNVSGGTKASSVSFSSLNQMTLPSNFEIEGMKTMLHQGDKARNIKAYHTITSDELHDEKSKV